MNNTLASEATTANLALVMSEAKETLFQFLKENIAKANEEGKKVLFVKAEEVEQMNHEEGEYFVGLSEELYALLQVYRREFWAPGSGLLN